MYFYCAKEEEEEEKVKEDLCAEHVGLVFYAFD